MDIYYKNVLRTYILFLEKKCCIPMKRVSYYTATSP